jgi:hypothetical protein
VTASSEGRQHGPAAPPPGAGQRPQCDNQSGVTTIQRPGTGIPPPAAPRLAGSDAFDDDNLMASPVPASFSSRVDTPSSGPFTETFFLLPFRWNHILDSNRPGHVAGRVHRPAERG